MRPTVSPSLLVLALVATGCGGSSVPGTAAPAPASSSAAPSSAVLPPSSAVTPEGFTAPGSRLVVGDTATVPLQRSGGEVDGTGELTVTSIEEVPAGRLDDAGGVPDGQVAWALRATLTVTEVADDFSSVQLGISLTGDVDGGPTNGLGIDALDELGCPAGDLGRSTEVGDVVDVCSGAVADAGVEVAAAWATPESAYTYRDGTPITWRR